MIGLLQRVARASVAVDGREIGSIGRGLLVFVCAEPGDDGALADRFVDKVLRLRVFADEAGRMNRDVVAAAGGLLIVSQFTLAADTSSGTRPGFSRAAEPALGRAIYDRVVATARARHADVACGEFGADMQVSLVNDGPVTIPLTLR